MSTATTKSAPAVPTSQPVQVGLSMPIGYRVFFLLVEPVSALVGAYYAHFRQGEYLTMTHAASAPSSSSSISPDALPTGTSVVLSQLANLYLLFALNEGLVLRATSDLRVWKTVLFGLLVADLGHLYSLRAAAGSPPALYWSVWDWNPIDWGNIAFVYLGATMRIAFLAGVGLGVKNRRLAKARNA